MRAIALAALVAAPLAAAEPRKAGDPADEAALLKNAEAFVDAFNKGDAKALAGFWTAEGDYTGQAGKRVAGRDALEKSFAEFFAENKGVKLRIDVAVLRFVTPDVAIEDGTTSVLFPDGGVPSRARYTIVHAKKDGKWLLDSVRESAFTPPSNYEHLKGLTWLIGEWADEAAGGEAARIALDWTDNQNFVVSHFTTTVKGANVGGGTQWIGWDPVKKTVRSWSFDSTGGFGEGTWAAEPGKWTIQSSATLSDGKKATSTHTVTRVDADTLTWAVTGRTLDGKPLDDIPAVKMKRAGK